MIKKEVYDALEKKLKTQERELKFKFIDDLPDDVKKLLDDI